MRDPTIILIAGRPGTGKSYYVNKMAKRDKRALIVTYAYNKSWKDLKMIDIKNKKKMSI